MTAARATRRKLSPRQQDIVDLLHQDLTQKEVADRLGVSVATVEELLSRARSRFGVGSTAVLLARAPARPRAERESVPDSQYMKIGTGRENALT